MFDVVALTAHLLNLEIPDLKAIQTTGPVRPVAPRQLQRQIRLPREQIVELVRQFEAGTPASALASRFGVNESTVLSHLKRAGVERSSYRKLHGELLDRAKELYLEQGWSQLAVAAELGISRGAVRSGLLAAGIRLRGRVRQ
jgi:hypothetical protein